MKQVALLIGCLLMMTTARAQDIDQITISLDLRQVSLEEVFHAIELVTPFRFNYKTANIAGVKNINCSYRHLTVKAILDQVLAGTSLRYEQVQRYILIKLLPKTVVNIFGYVRVANSGEALSGASISIAGKRNYHAVTNAYGFYSVLVVADDYFINYSFVGFDDKEIRANVQQATQYNIGLSIAPQEPLQPITVTTAAGKNAISKLNTGYHGLSMTDIKTITMAGGEPDVLKSLQFLPGIQTAAEGTTNISVRGGSYDQNLILLDEAPVYNPTHSLGFFSAFNTDALKDVAIYKGVFPAQYGSRLSSVIDLRMKEGNSKRMSVAGGLGLFASRLTFEGPIKKDSSSFIVSARYSNVGAVLDYADATNLTKLDINGSQVAYYDVNAKFNTVIGKRNRLYLSAYTGHDRFQLHLIEKQNDIRWGNTTVSARWNHVFHSGLFANTSLLYSNYNYSNISIADTRNFTWRARLQELTLKTDFDKSVNSSIHLKMGAGITGQSVLPGAVKPQQSPEVSEAVSLHDRQSLQLFGYVQHEQRFSDRLAVSAGIRATLFAAFGHGWTYQYAANKIDVTDSSWQAGSHITKTFFGAEPKLSVRYLIVRNTALKFSVGRNYQFHHLLTSSSVGLPTDMWLPAGVHFKPQYADQLAAGIYKTFQNDRYEASMELYYRKSHNIIDFRDGAEIFLNDKIETQVLSGEAKGYGMEWLIKKTRGRSAGWVSYTLSKALRRVNGVNHNEWYSPAYDHRHNVSLLCNYMLNRRWTISGNWIYRSGGYTTVPAGSYIYNGVRFLYYDKRNSYLLPATHRLDLSVTWRWKQHLHRRKWQDEWVLSVYNVYNRHNVFALYTSQDPHDYTAIKATQVYLTGILPSITYNFKF